MEKIVSIVGTLFMAIPIIITSFYMNQFIGNPLQEQRKRKKIKNILTWSTIAQTVGLGCFIYSFFI